MTNVTTMNDMSKALANIETAPLTYSNTSPMRGRFTDSAAKTPRINVDAINRANKELNASSLSPWKDLTGKNTLLVSTCTTGHGHARWANHLRVMSIGKTGNTSIYSGGHYAHGTTFDSELAHVVETSKRATGRTLNVLHFDYLATASDYKQNPNTPDKAQMFLSKCDSNSKTENYKVWNWDGANIHLLTEVKHIPRSTAFDVVFNSIKTKIAELIDIPKDNVKFKYMGVVSAPL